MKVSVLIATYNHRPYIQQALESAIHQQTDFPYEILVGEDCSTDGTREIVEQYARKYPDLIRAILHEKNIGGHANLSGLFQSAKGEYLAWLEGDDYWTDPQKLQKQVQILEADKSLVISFHRTSIVNENGVELRDSEAIFRPKTKTGMKELIRKNYLHTPSCMYRNKVVDLTPNWINQLALGDWPRHLLLAQHGKIHYLDEKMAAYRETQTGIWHVRGQHYQYSKSLEMLKLADQYTEDCYNWDFKVSQLRLALGVEIANQKMKGKGKGVWLNCLRLLHRILS